MAFRVADSWMRTRGVLIGAPALYAAITWLLGAGIEAWKLLPLVAIVLVMIAAAKPEPTWLQAWISLIVTFGLVIVAAAMGSPPIEGLAARLLRRAVFALTAAGALWIAVEGARAALLESMRPIRIALGRMTVVSTVLLLAVLVVGNYFLVKLNALGPDAGSYLVTAIKVSEGQIPFVDFVTLYHPGVYYVQVLWFWLLGSDLSAVQLQLVIQHSIVAACLALVLRWRFRLGFFGLTLTVGSYFIFMPVIEGLQYAVEPMVGMFGWAGLAVSTWAATRERGRAAAAFAGALLASAAFWVKQPGFVFLAAIPLVHLDAGRFQARVLAAQLAAFFVLPALFLALHPSAAPLYWHQGVERMFAYSAGDVSYQPPFSVTLAALAQNATAPVLLALAALVGRRGDRLIVIAGLLALVPCFFRPFRHYYLLALPFAMFGLGVLLRQAGPWMQRRWIAVPALALIVGGVASYVRLIGAEPPGGADEERAVAAYIDERAGGEALIVPASPQYYFLTGTRPPDDDLTFIDSDAHFEAARARFEAAAARKLPAFVVESDLDWEERCRERLRALGFTLRDSEGAVEFWAPP